MVLCHLQSRKDYLGIWLTLDLESCINLWLHGKDNLLLCLKFGESLSNNMHAYKS